MNFIGANNILKSQVKSLRDNTNGIGWHYIRSGFPHFGGVSNIKSVKILNNFERTIGVVDLILHSIVPGGGNP